MIQTAFFQPHWQATAICKDTNEPLGWHSKRWRSFVWSSWGSAYDQRQSASCWFLFWKVSPLVWVCLKDLYNQHHKYVKSQNIRNKWYPLWKSRFVTWKGTISKGEGDSWSQAQADVKKSYKTWHIWRDFCVPGSKPSPNVGDSHPTF